MTQSLLLPALFGISCLDWWVAGKKGLALVQRSPMFIFWACLEVALGGAVGYGLYDAFSSKSGVGAIVALTLGCGVGCLVSGVVKWRSYDE